MHGVQLLLAVVGVLVSAWIPAVPSEELVSLSHQLLMSNSILPGNTDSLGWVLVHLLKNVCGPMLN